MNFLLLVESLFMLESDMKDGPVAPVHFLIDELHSVNWTP